MTISDDTKAQDQGELFDVMPDPSTVGSLEDPDALMELMAANTNGRFETVTRGKAHAEGYWHRSIGLWLYTRDGKVVLQKRSMMKDTNPGKWQMSVAGHVSSGQSVLDTVITETKEEMGISIVEKDLKFVGIALCDISGTTERFGHYINREYAFIFIMEIPSDLQLDFNPDEVEKVEWVDAKYAFERFREEDPLFCPENIEYINKAGDLIARATRSD
jgi:isopentenyl-diphosphate delta-isomerase